MKEDALICEKLCIRIFGKPCMRCIQLSASGSGRRYYRVSVDGRTFLICVSDNVKENKTFIEMANMLWTAHIPVPRIFGSTLCDRAYLLEDLGSKDLFGLLQSRSDFRSVEFVIKKAVKGLVEFQMLPKECWGTIVEFPPLDKDLIEFDFRYACDNFFNRCAPGFDKKKLNKDFTKLEECLLTYPGQFWGLMYRDFQSRNIMLSPSPCFIDFQSARFGPGIYDIVSFAWQAKAKFSKLERNQIIEFYIDSYSEKGVDCRFAVESQICFWGLFRVLQTLGAYGLRGLKEGKRHFIESIPTAVHNLCELMEDYKMENEFPEIYKIIKKIDIDGR